MQLHLDKRNNCSLLTKEGTILLLAKRGNTYTSKNQLAMSGRKGGCRHTAKPHVDMLLETLKKHESLLKHFGPYSAISANQAVDPKGLIHCLGLLEDLVKLSPTAEIHPGPLRQALLKMLGGNPRLNDGESQIRKNRYHPETCEEGQGAG